MSETPPLRFSAVIPAHNAMPLVLRAVESALGQTCPPAEVVVVDDRSSDGTAEALDALVAAGKPVKVVRGHFGGAAAARNAGWRAATSPWIAFLDADDVWLPEKLEVAARTLAAAPRASWFFSDSEQIPHDGSTMDSLFTLYAEVPEGYVGQPVAPLMQINFIATPAAVARRDALEELGGFDETMSHAEDRDLWIRLARRGPGAASPRALIRVFQQPGGLTSQVELRLMGDVQLFGKLSRDRTLDPASRRFARRSASLAHLKLAFNALRDGDRPRARRHLRAAWQFPDRVMPVVSGYVTTLLPAPVMALLRRQRWAGRAIVAPALRPPRVRLVSEPGGGSAGVSPR